MLKRNKRYTPNNNLVIVRQQNDVDFEIKTNLQLDLVKISYELETEVNNFHHEETITL